MKVQGHEGRGRVEAVAGEHGRPGSAEAVAVSRWNAGYLEAGFA